MLHIQPPYRLETIEEVKKFIPPLPNEHQKAMLRFAKTSAKDIKKPPILNLLPQQIDIDLREVTNSARWIVEDIDLSSGLEDTVFFIDSERNRFLDAVSGLEDKYFDVFKRIIREGKEYQSKKKTGKDREESSASSVNVSSLLQDQSDAYDLLLMVLRRYLNTKKAPYLEFLRKSISQICAFDRNKYSLDHSIIDRFQTLPASSSLILNDLRTLYVERLEKLKMEMFRPHCHHFLLSTKNKITKLPLPVNVKRNTIDVLNQVIYIKDIEKARKKITHLFSLYQDRVDPEELLRLKGIIDNFYEKLNSFDSFFKTAYSADRIEKFYKVFCVNLSMKKIDIESIICRILFNLYPCKDIHDFLKGDYSSDCSSSSSGMAAGHLLHPRFFNVRIFNKGNWIGCIYMLDFSDQNVMIIDRIQIKNDIVLLLFNFFPIFMKQFADYIKIKEDLKILAPSSISNFWGIQNSFDQYAKTLPKMKFPLGISENIFESFRQKSFYIVG